MYSHPDLRNSTVVDVPVRRLRPCHSKACYGRERAILSMIRTLRRLGIPVVLLAAEIRASSTFYHRHLAPKVDLLEATRRRVPSRVRRSMTGAHAAAIGLESIDIMCTVTYFNATSTVARRIRADRDGLHRHACSYADMFGSTGLVDREGVGMASNALAHSCNPT